MATRMLVVAELKAASSEAADKIAETLIGVSKYSRSNEPGVTKYMICRPNEPSETSTVWAIEEYADKQVYDAHMDSQPVKDLITMMSTEPVLAGAPAIYMLSYVPELEVTKPEASDLSDPLIVFATIDFVSGKRDDTLKYWKNNIEAAKDESGVFVYSMAKAEDRPDTLFTVEAYENEKYLNDVHIPAAHVQDTIKNTKEARQNLTLAKLRLRGGYVHKKA